MYHDNTPALRSFSIGPTGLMPESLLLIILRISSESPMSDDSANNRPCDLMGSQINTSSAAINELLSVRNVRNTCDMHLFKYPLFSNGRIASENCLVKRNGINSGMLSFLVATPNAILKSMPINWPLFLSITKFCK